MEHFIDLARQTGLEVLSRKQEKGWFCLELKKPA
jgi:hypothetical protein